MLHIILVILKTFGIILASILGILLIFILLALFVPIRYIVKAEKYDNFILDGKVSWLFHFLYLRILYHDNDFHMKLKIIGITFFDNKRIKSKKKAKKSKKNKKSKNKSKIKQRKVQQRKRNKKTKTSDELNNGSDVKKIIYEDDNDSNVKNTVYEEENDSNVKNAVLKEDNISNIKEENSYYVEDMNSNPEDSKSFYENVKEKPNVFQRIKRKIIKIKESIKKAIFSFIEKIKAIFRSFKNIKSNINKILEILKAEENKCGIKKIYISLKKTLKHIFPLKIKGNLKFGTGDPCSTGQILAGISIAYPIYQNNVKIIPDFENEIIEGEGFAKGRIRLITLLIICIKLVLDKNFKQLLKNLKNFKEEL